MRLKWVAIKPISPTKANILKTHEIGLGMKNILIVETDPLFRETLVGLLKNQTGLEKALFSMGYQSWRSLY
ncbi:MAG: hypothetical protein KKF30_09060 [Proteobacteria bacterium]|nr:hypothetical protein [Pseudomonadota bacterium]MBU4470521.1 hypothetical protein [Pseudomonadota bacterium]MCG2751357.1 hypothetical protein [Desulfobacteraceae bacterium]